MVGILGLFGIRKGGGQYVSSLDFLSGLQQGLGPLKLGSPNTVAAVGLLVAFIFPLLP